MSAAVGPIPNVVSFAIGGRFDHGSLLGYVGVVKRVGRTGPLFGTIENKGLVNLVFSVRESTDDGVVDSYEATKATGLVTLLANPSDTHRLTISDGVTAATFEFDSNAAVTGGNILVTIGVDAAASLAALKVAINAHAFNVTATDAIAGDPANTLHLTNDTAAAAGNVAITKSGASISVSGMSGGQDDQNINLRVGGANVTSITVPPGGKGIFVIEEAAFPGLLLGYLKLIATPAATACGQVMLLNALGELVHYEMVGAA